MAEEKEKDYTPQWRLEAANIACKMFQNNDGNNGTNKAEEFIDFAEKISKWLLNGKNEEN